MDSSALVSVFRSFGQTSPNRILDADAVIQQFYPGELGGEDLVTFYFSRSDTTR